MNWTTETIKDTAERVGKQFNPDLDIEDRLEGDLANGALVLFSVPEVCEAADNGFIPEQLVRKLAQLVADTARGGKNDIAVVIPDAISPEDWEKSRKLRKRCTKGCTQYQEDFVPDGGGKTRSSRRYPESFPTVKGGYKNRDAKVGFCLAADPKDPRREVERIEGLSQDGTASSFEEDSSGTVSLAQSSECVNPGARRLDAERIC